MIVFSSPHAEFSAEIKNFENIEVKDMGDKWGITFTRQHGALIEVVGIKVMKEQPKEFDVQRLVKEKTGNEGIL